MNIFIDTQDMEESYGEELYKEYLEKENKQLKEERKEILELIKNRNTSKSKKERFISGKSTLNKISEILGGKEND